MGEFFRVLRGRGLFFRVLRAKVADAAVTAGRQHDDGANPRQGFGVKDAHFPQPVGQGQHGQHPHEQFKKPDTMAATVFPMPCKAERYWCKR